MSGKASSIILIAVAPTDADVEMAAAAVTEAVTVQTLPSQAMLYAPGKFAAPAPVRSRAMNGLAPEALVQLHNAGLLGERSERDDYFRAGFTALALSDALKGARAGTVAAWTPDPASMLGGRLDVPATSETVSWLASARGTPWHVVRLDDPVRFDAALARTVDAYLSGVVWRLRDRRADQVLLSALEAVA